MGYSISTPMKSPEAKAKMLAFMEEHYRGLSEIDPSFIDPEWDSSCHLTDDLDYDRGTTKIGYNYGTLSESLRYYCVSILSWMALHSGKTKRFWKLSKGFSAPYWRYDGEESYPILNVDLWRDRITTEAALYATGLGVSEPILCESLRPGVYKIMWAQDRVLLVAAVDSTGYRPSPFHWAKYPNEAEEKALIEPVVKAELIRLTELWN